MSTKEHIDSGFNKYVQEHMGTVCPTGGMISYVDGRVTCRLHSIYVDHDVDTNKVCLENYLNLEEQYCLYLVTEGKQHTDKLFV